MKVLKYLTVAAMAICLASCGGKGNANANEGEQKDTAAVEQAAPAAVTSIEDITDPAVLPAAVTAALKAADKARVNELVDLWVQKIQYLKHHDGDPKPYIDALGAFYKDNKDALVEAGVQVENIDFVLEQ